MYSIADKLKGTNIAEYLIYMWQIEDLIRANNLDIDRIKSIFPSVMSETEITAELNWYSELIDMMRVEGVTDSGHLQISQNVIINLLELHKQLMESSKFPFYSGAYYKALPFIVELRSKSRGEMHNELLTCFEALYGVMLLKLQHKEISKETQEAVTVIASFVSMLANYYHKEKSGDLKFD